ncbi:hypothetical protein [Gymnodinialimonas sp.]
MKRSSLTLAALLLALGGPTFAQTACETGFTIGADGDCEAVMEETTTLTTTEPDPDNPGGTIEVEVTPEPEPEPTTDPDTETTVVAVN